MLEAGLRRRSWITLKCSGRDKPLAAMLRLLGVQNSNLVLGRDGAIEIQPSHFETENLIARKRFTVHEFFVLDGNLADGAAGLPDYDIVLNSIGDPDVESASLESAQRFIARQSAPHINSPERVLWTSRDRIYELLHDVEGVVVPKAYRLDSPPQDGPSFWRCRKARDRAARPGAAGRVAFGAGNGPDRRSGGLGKGRDGPPGWPGLRDRVP
jgi:hypothetical protein